LINEITELQSFLTLTFGLTEGWWHYEDEENRIKGSPLIHRKKWLQLLSNSGYRKINFFNLEEIITDSSTVSGPTVIAAESDGVNISKSVNPEKHNLKLKNISHYYENFVHWQSEMIGSEKGDKQFQYWQKQLSGTLPVLNLPLDHKRPSQQTFSGNWIPFRLNPDLSEKLKRFARSKGVTLYSLLLSAYFILLHRYTGQNDLLVGCPTTGRPHQSFNDIVGDFVNTIVVRANCSTNPTVAEFIVQVSQTLLNALNHQDYPFSLLVERLNPKRNPSVSPIFQTMFVFQKPHNFTDFIDTVTDFYAEEGIMEMYGYQFKSFPFPQQEGQFDLSIEMTGSEDLLKGVLKYNSDLFDNISMKRMCKNFIAILQCVVEHPLEHLSDLDYIDEKDKLRMLVEWNNTGEEFDIKCVHELFENQAKLTPEAIALVFKGQQLSYGELNYRANQLANYLISKGVKPDDSIGICVKRSFEMIIGILGILKAGGAYVPLDELYPRERLSFMLDDSKISFLLISDNLFDIFESFRGDLIHMDKDRHLIAQKDGSDPHRDISFNNLAYILYTSGSTGTPKGVAMPHRSLCNLISWQNRNANLSKNAKTLQFTTLTFDVSFQEIFSTLSSGGALLLFDSSLRQDPFALLELMQTKSVERLFTPFAFLQALAEAAETNSEIVPLNLKEIITAGEQLRITTSIINFINKLDNCTLYNQYGPTETHVVTCFSLEDNPDRWSYLPPIGKPIANTQIYILDKNLKPVSQGVFGELFIGGMSLARRYCNHPELTSQRFIKNPFSLNEDRLYRTGDIVRYLPDGNIEFHGRADHQIKIRGYRIEPFEIEKRLIDHDLITDAVVVGIENINGIKSLCAYYVTKSDISIADIRSYLSDKLPSYMLPSYFTQLEQIPLLPNNKIDRLSLPKPNQDLSLGVEYFAPRDDIEKRLEEICREIVNTQKVGIETNIFDIGINSLTTITMHRKIEHFYPGKIKIPDFIQHPTISSLASLIKKRDSSQRKTSEKENQYQIFLESITKVEQ
jgi:amino acid adenylation domain-containing protein